jgi:NAD dependent epimerase/dehydratase family enzyme
MPAFILKLIMGEMSSFVLSSTRVSSKKVEDAGFTFKYPDISAALREIYG